MFKVQVLVSLAIFFIFQNARQVHSGFGVSYFVSVTTPIRYRVITRMASATASQAGQEMSVQCVSDAMIYVGQIACLDPLQRQATYFELYAVCLFYWLAFK